MQASQSTTDVLSAQRELLARPRFVLIAGLTISLFALVLVISVGSSNLFTSAATTLNSDTIDQRLQRAALQALGDRRGTAIVMDPQTGRVRAVVNPQMAFEQELPPGSTIKPFTTLAALRSEVINEDSRTLCREEYAHDEFHTTCSHPRDLPPLNPTDAIAYSCNYYFGKVGENLSETNFSATLDEFGFGKATGVNTAHESAGSLRRNPWRTQNAIGEGDYLRATPVQVISAYSTLVNGGQRFTPQVAGAAGFVTQARGRVAIKSDDRKLILNGMRGAIRYGTAETAHLYSLPLYVFGKTGTATEINGFRSQGWFVGFAAVNEEEGSTELAPENVRLAVLVFLAKAHGSDAAEAARTIFAEYSRAIEEYGDTESKSLAEKDNAANTLAENSPRLPVSDLACLHGEYRPSSSRSGEHNARHASRRIRARGGGNGRKSRTRT